jgi:hypothetical protein
MKYYVYTYSDDVVFYVGKGIRDRDVSHWKKALKGKKTHNSRLAKRLSDLVDQNRSPKIERVFMGSAKECLLEEAKLIAQYRRFFYDEGGTLMNHSVGLEGVPKDSDLRDEYLNTVDLLPHFNEKQYPERMKIEACALYDTGHTQREVQKIVSEKYMKVTIAMLRRWWIDAGLRIRTKSEVRLGEQNPAYGRRGLRTKGFAGRQHSEESKAKTRDTLLAKRWSKIDWRLLSHIEEATMKGQSELSIAKDQGISTSKVRNYKKRLKIGSARDLQYIYGAEGRWD